MKGFGWRNLDKTSWNTECSRHSSIITQPKNHRPVI